MQIIKKDKLKCVQLALQLIVDPPAFMLTWIEEDRDILHKLSNELNTPLTTLLDITMLVEAIDAQIYIDPTLPQWIVEAFESTLKKYLSSKYAMMFSSEEVIRLQGGAMVTEIVTNMLAIANDEASGKNILIYSGHDTTVLSLAYALRVQSQIPALPSYGDTFMVDLLDNGTVQVIYLNTANRNHTQHVMKVPGCGTSCSLATFRQAVNDMWIEDWDALCGV